MSSDWPDLQDFDGAQFLGQDGNHGKLEHKVTQLERRLAEYEQRDAQSKRWIGQLQQEAKERDVRLNNLTTLVGSLLGGL